MKWEYKQATCWYSDDPTPHMVREQAYKFLASDALDRAWKKETT